ncbi:MAG: WSC domain-containing protein [Olpidium bornovanus]|uniref:WSC domain-containing protein n=1 Tax=Olpidium bornovanus TaxID=278681 RepID=A0A8H7ZUY2_9FUNG|nr:MAG: WSC domain-containing protein [Olpidium bornovanus]
MIKKIRRFGISALLFSAVSSLYFVSRKGLPPPSASPESRFDFRYYDDDGGGANPAGERSRNQAALLSAASDSREPGLRKLSEQEELINALERDIRGQKDSLKEYAQLVRSLQDEIAKRGADRAGKTSSSPPLAATGAGNGTADGPLASKGERVGPGAGKRPDASTRPSENKHDRLDALLAANYMGCYPDSFNNRDLPEFFPAFTTSPAKCIATCRSHGHNFAGLQDGGECWCGSELPRRTKLPDSQCQKRCSGDPLKFCGGTLKNSVYKAG